MSRKSKDTCVCGVERCWTVSCTLKEETFAGRNFRGFAVFSQIRESLFPQNFSKDVIRESFFPQNFLKSRHLRIF